MRLPLLATSLAFVCCGFLAKPGLTEGSNTIVSSGGDRPYLVYRNTDNFGIPNRTTIKVYVNAGETINLGSSAVGIGNGIINYRSPNGTPGNCGTQGLIANRTEEQNGPDINPGDPGYTPCIINSVATAAAGSGIWEIDFLSPDPNGANPPPITGTASWTQAANVATVAAWDVTVRNSTNTGLPIDGRAYANYLALIIGDNGRSLSSQFVIQTKDGYRYRVDMNNLDPNGFIFFANNNGYKDAATNQPLYRSIQLDPPGPNGVLPPSVIIEPPGGSASSLPTATTDITHKIFFNSPNPDLLGITSTPSPNGPTWLVQDPAPIPPPTNFSFEGREANTPGQAGISPLGGSFKFDTTIAGSYTITLDFNNNGVADSNDRILFGTATIGANTVPWDGLDANGVPVPASAVPYNARIVLNAGEVHFPFFDVENNPSGLIVERLLPSVPDPNPFKVFYNDTGLTGGTPPSPPNALAGVLSNSGAHSYSGLYGDQKGIDTWALFPSQPFILSGGIKILAADLKISKVGPASITAGSPITYTIKVTNNGPSNLTAPNLATVIDNVPASITGVNWTCAITTGTGSCTNGSGSGNNINTTIALNSGAEATYTVTGIVSPSANGTLENTAAVQRPADVTDPVDDDDNPDDPTNRNEETTFTTQIIQENAQLGIAKAVAGTPTDNGDRTFNVPYTLTIRNFGNVPLNNLQVTEDLQTTFAGATGFNVVAATSPTLTINPNFNGGNDKNLLSGTNTLEPAATATINLTLRVTPGATLGPYNNTARAEGISPANTVARDDSTDQTGVPNPNPDANGNNNPGDDSTTTPVSFPQNPKLGVAKTAGPATGNSDGTFTIPYTVTVKNFGNVPLSNLQVVENLTPTFAAPATFIIESGSVSNPSGGLTINPNFNGSTTTNLLAGTDTLPVNSASTISFRVRVTPGANLGPYTNTANGTATSPSGTPVQDDSTDGSLPEFDPDAEQPTVVTINASPVLGVAKQAGTVVNNGDGSYTIPYTINVRNLGNVPLSNLAIAEDMRATFAGPAVFAIVAGSLSATNGLTVNPTFDGKTNNDLLTPTGNNLPAGDRASISFQVRLTPNGNLGPYNNSVVGNATGPDGTTTSDNSNNGDNPDDGNNNPNEPNDNQPTVVRIAEQPVLGVAKDVVSAVNNGNRTYTVTYNILVKNLGDVPLSNLQVTDSLDTTFVGAQSFRVNSVSAINGPLTANTNFSGILGNNRLLSGTNVLPVGQSGTIQVVVLVTPGSNLGPYNNTANGTATGGGGTQVSDASNNGTDPDNDGGDAANDNDNDPTNNNVPTAVQFAGGPNLRLVKRITAVIRNGVPISGVNFNAVVDDPEDQNDTAAGWSQVGLRGVSKLGQDISLSSGDQVEYTIYFLSDGSSPASNVRFCDAIPSGTTYLGDGFAAGSGILVRLGANEASRSNVADADGGEFVSPVAALPQPNGCPNQDNPANGAVIVNFGDLNNTNGSNFGFVRFKVKID